jgi:hypothetical protein
MCNICGMMLTANNALPGKNCIRANFSTTNLIEIITTVQLMLYGEIRAVCSEIHTHNTYTVWAEFVNVTPGGIYSIVTTGL